MDTMSVREKLTEQTVIGEKIEIGSFCENQIKFCWVIYPCW